MVRSADKTDGRAASGMISKDLGYCFQDETLLERALTHPSYANENASVCPGDNERLEFLGDAVLGFVITDLIIHTHPGYSEGRLSKLRAALVNEQSLAALARGLKLGDYLLLGKGEATSGGRDKPSVLSDAFEALVAAVYLDGGFDKTVNIIKRLFDPLIAATHDPACGDYKTALQGLCHARFKSAPVYILTSASGPDHNRIYEIGILVGGEPVATGRGRSKKEAEQQAARSALSKFSGGLISCPEGDL